MKLPHSSDKSRSHYLQSLSCFFFLLLTFVTTEGTPIGSLIQWQLRNAVDGSFYHTSGVKLQEIFAIQLHCKFTSVQGKVSSVCVCVCPKKKKNNSSLLWDHFITWVLFLPSAMLQLYWIYWCSSITRYGNAAHNNLLLHREAAPQYFLKELKSYQSGIFAATQSCHHASASWSLSKQYATRRRVSRLFKAAAARGILR